MKNKSKSTAFLLCYSLGFLGIHRFYLNKVLTGVLMLISGGGLGIWWIVDIYQIARGHMRDKQGQELYAGPPDPSDLKAGFWVRLAAITVDGLLAALIALIVISLPIVLITKLGLFDLGPTDLQMLALAGGLGELLVFFLYMSIPLTRQHQATPGKRCFGLQVTTRDGDPLGLPKALWRTFCYLFSAIPLYLGFVLAAFKNKRALHDFLAGTKVSYVEASNQPQMQTAEPEAITEVASPRASVVRNGVDSTSTRGPVMLMLLGVILLLAAAALAVL